MALQGQIGDLSDECMLIVGATIFPNLALYHGRGQAYAPRILGHPARIPLLCHLLTDRRCRKDRNRASISKRSMSRSRMLRILCPVTSAIEFVPEPEDMVTIDAIRPLKPRSSRFTRRSKKRLLRCLLLAHRRTAALLLSSQCLL